MLHTILDFWFLWKKNPTIRHPHSSEARVAGAKAHLPLWKTPLLSSHRSFTCPPSRFSYPTQPWGLDTFVPLLRPSPACLPAASPGMLPCSPEARRRASSCSPHPPLPSPGPHFLRGSRLPHWLCSMNLASCSPLGPSCWLTLYLWVLVTKCLLCMCTHTLTQEVFHFLTQKAPTLTDRNGHIQLHLLSTGKESCQ